MPHLPIPAAALLLCATLVLCLARPPQAQAQVPDCAQAVTQLDLNLCAEADWQRADRDLNEAYAAAMDLLKSWEGDLPENLRGGPETLRTAQRAWISYRDAACAAEGYAMRGGSAEPLLVYGCLARLTEARARDLWDFTSAYEG